MSQSDFEPISKSKPYTYEDEQLNMPDSIQPHGILLALDQQDFIITHISNNSQEYLGIAAKDLLDKPLTSLIDSSEIEIIKKTLSQSQGINNALRLSLNTSQGKQLFWGMIHQTVETTILELEPINPPIPDIFVDFPMQINKILIKFQQASNQAEFLNLVASEVSVLTELDRVMIYQFTPQGDGKVVAEVIKDGVSSYLGLHYPGTDIPEASREMYLKCRFRFIPKLDAQAVKLIASPNLKEDSSLDLSLAYLRSVHSCCIEFHRNMGVETLMVIPLIKDEQLWGLISCHHQTPKPILFSVRLICELLGRFVSLELVNKINQEQLDYKLQLKSISSHIIQEMAKKDTLRSALLNPSGHLQELFQAQGVAICLDQEIVLIGQTPSHQQISALIDWADFNITDSIFQTNTLSQIYPEAEAFAEIASGLLLLRISQVRRYYLLWFREEMIQTVKWAGNPTESIQIEQDGTIILSPRKSFEIWQESVRFTSQPWTASEIENALELRRAIIGLILNQADELTKLNQKLEISNQELSSFAFAASHDLKEPLRGIHNYAVFVLEDYAEILDELGLGRLETVVHLTKRMESLIDVLLKYSLLGQAELNVQHTNLNQLLAQVIDVFRVSYPQSKLEIRIKDSLPTINCDPVLINEVFSNLINNAHKYNTKDQPWLKIGYLNPEQQLEKGWINQHQLKLASPVFYVQDNGIGIRERHQETIFRLFKRLHAQSKYGGGTGAGLTIAKKIVEKHGGKLWVESNYGEGSTFYFSLKSFTI